MNLVNLERVYGRAENLVLISCYFFFFLLTGESTYMGYFQILRNYHFQLHKLKSCLRVNNGKFSFEIFCH